MPPLQAGFTVLAHGVLRYRAMRPEVARNALLAIHGGLRWEGCAVGCEGSPMALDRVVCARGHQRVVVVRTRCGLPRPADVLADDTHSHGLADRVSLPTIIRGHVIGPLGYTEAARAAALTQSYGALPRAAS
jgi:hypothetical protein